MTSSAMTDAIIVLNAGSSSIKFSLFALVDDDCVQVLRDQIEGLGADLGHAAALQRIMAQLQEQAAQYRLRAVGHRVVHGGAQYSAPLLLTAAHLANLERLIPLAPLHQGHNLAPVRALLQQQPQLPQVACFDTAFHAVIPELTQMYALPATLRKQGIRRYGFHGLSYEYIAQAFRRINPAVAQGKVLVLHLGNGVSVCAMENGKSRSCSMGFSTLDGVPMGTRSGAIDPGVLLYLMDELGMDARAIEKLLYQQSGLLGVSGISSDMRTLEASSDAQAQLAIDVFVERLVQEMGAQVAGMGGVDAIVFTAGIGEHSAKIRERVCRAMAWLGVEVDTAANSSNEQCITTANSRVSAWVIPTNEELMIARQTINFLNPPLINQ